MNSLWSQFRGAIPLITHVDPFIRHLLWVTLKVAGISTGAAVLIGLPVALLLARGAFRGRRLMLVLANAGLALPPVLVGTFVLLLTIPRSVFPGLRLAYTINGVYVVQAILALPYVVVLGASAMQALPEGLFAQARALGARPLQLAWLALSEARIGILAGVIAAVGVVISEVGAVVIIGGNIEGDDQTLASALLAQFNFSSDNQQAIAIGIVLLILILILAGLLTFLQHRAGPVRRRWVVS